MCIGASGCGSTTHIYSPLARNPEQKVELVEAKGKRPTPGRGQLLVRYLRAGGVYFEWQGRAILTAPFASNYPLSPALLLHQKAVSNEAAIEHIMAGDMRLDAIESILVGHSHYDHIGDVPLIASKYAKKAKIYVNASGSNMLAGSGLDGRVVALDDKTGFLPPGYEARRDLIRFRAIPSEHAPNLEVIGLEYSWGKGAVEEAWSDPLANHRLKELRVGTTFAFLIDFMDPADPNQVAYRVHYQDAASRPPLGYPANFLVEQRPIDLEVLTLPGRETLPDIDVRYPVGILQHTRARHALVIHYEDFFRRVLTSKGSSNGVRLIPTLAGSTSTDFLDAVGATIRNPDPGPCGNPAAVEGLCADAFTVPLPGAWLLFDTDLARR